MPEDTLIKTESLTEDEKGTLDLLLDMIIPASLDGQMPSASEINIYEVLCAENMVPWLHEGLKCIVDEAQQKAGQSVSVLGGSLHIDVVERVRRKHPRYFATLANIIIQCYYQDPRVIKAIGLEVRPPFPRGYLLEEGDFCLLETVYERGPIYRH
jgi:hypothetical protein